MIQSETRRAAWPLAGLAAIFLSGCTLNPMMTGPRMVTPAPTQQTPRVSGDMAQIDRVDDATASGAEQACIAAGRERGLDVLGVVGSRAVTATTGGASRDVMLRVRRSGAEIEVRCNYVADTRMARIMLI